MKDERILELVTERTYVRESLTVDDAVRAIRTALAEEDSKLVNWERECDRIRAEVWREAARIVRHTVADKPFFEENFEMRAEALEAKTDD